MKKLLVQRRRLRLYQSGYARHHRRYRQRHSAQYRNVYEYASAVLAASLMKDRPQACFGIDFNIVSGPSVCDPPADSPFSRRFRSVYRSKDRLKDPRFQTEAGRREMFPFDETYREIRAQYDRFVALTGRRPGYLHGHSLRHEALYGSDFEGQPGNRRAVFSTTSREAFGFKSLFDLRREQRRDPAKTKKEFDPLAQLNKNPLQDILDHQDYLLSGEYLEIGGHPGFVDAELMDLTTPFAGADARSSNDDFSGNPRTGLKLMTSN